MVGANGSDARAVVAVIGVGIMGSAMVRNLLAGGPAEQRKLLILASGPAAAAEWVGPVFGILGRRTVWLGAAGQGSQVKLAAGHGRQDISAARLALASRSLAS